VLNEETLDKKLGGFNGDMYSMIIVTQGWSFQKWRFTHRGVILGLINFIVL